MDNYIELKNATPEQLLEAAANYYEKFDPAAGAWIRLGFKLAQSGGWRQVAEDWLQAIDATAKTE